MPQFHQNDSIGSGTRGALVTPTLVSWGGWPLILDFEFCLK